MMLNITVKKLLAVVGLGLASLHAQAGLLNGESVGFTYYYPTLASTYAELDSAVVGDGVEFDFFDMFSVDVADSSIVINNFFYSDSDTAWDAASFSGFVIRDLGGFINLTAAVLDVSSNMVGLDASRISFDARSVYVNWQGLAFNSGTQVKINLQGESARPAVSVPESSSLLLALLGLAGVLLRCRRA